MTSGLYTEIGFSLGSNLGDRVAHLCRAKARILEQPQARPAAQSSIYETEPVGVKAEYADKRFLNAVLVIESSWPVEPWLARLAEIEDQLGRVRSEDRFAPRTMDIDILYAGGTCIDSGGLIVPHPRWALRRFVVEPLAEIRPDLELPGAGRTVQAILDDLAHGEACVRIDTPW